MQIQSHFYFLQTPRTAICLRCCEDPFGFSFCLYFSVTWLEISAIYTRRQVNQVLKHLRVALQNIEQSIVPHLSRRVGDGEVRNDP